MKKTQVKELESAMQKDDVSYLSASRQLLLYRWRGRLDGLTLICADPNVLGKYFALTDAKTGEDLSIPKDGILIQKRMKESYSIEEGDKLPIVDNNLVEHKARGYLTREAIITTIAGLVLGVALGAIITPPVIAILQQPDLEFVKHFHVSAWAVAVVLEAAFAIIINTVVFNKVKKLNLRDIA